MPLRLQSIVQRYTLCGRKEWYKSGMSTLPESTASSWWKRKTFSAASSLSRAVRMLSKTGASASSDAVSERSTTRRMHIHSIASRVSSRERTSFWRSAPPL